MMKSGIIVFLTTVMFGKVASQCDVMNCDDYGLLTQENSLGLIGSDEVDELCRIINQLDMCISRQIKNCDFEQRKQFEPALNSAKVICQNSDAYKQAGQCYFNPDVVEAFDICLEDLDPMTCGSLTTYQNCITTDTSVRDQCSKEDIKLLNAITTASVQTFLIRYNCVATTTVTTQQSTTMTSTTITASKTTLDNNGSSGSAPMSGMMGGRASSMENNFVLSVLTLLSVLIALCLDL